MLFDFFDSNKGKARKVPFIMLLMAKVRRWRGVYGVYCRWRGVEVPLMRLVYGLRHVYSRFGAFMGCGLYSRYSPPGGRTLFVPVNRTIGESV
jgi:hypothetical protein